MAPFSFFRGERIGAHGAPYATTTGYAGSWVGCAVRTNAVRLVRGSDCRWRQAPGRALGGCGAGGARIARRAGLLQRTHEPIGIDRAMVVPSAALPALPQPL